MSFDEKAYRDQLIAHGIEPGSAASTARRTAQARVEAEAVLDKTVGELFGHTRSRTNASSPVKAKANEQTAGLSDTAAPAAPTSRALVLKMPTTPALKSPPKVTRNKDVQLITVAAEIAGAPPSSDQMQFMHAIMCQVGLPRSKVTGSEFERRCGNAALSVSAGKLWDGTKFVQQPIPYGALPRLMLAWMNTFAVRERTPEIPVGESASGFLRMLGKDQSGGKRGTFTMFRTQVQALSACRMTLGFNANGRAYTYDGKPIKQFEAWLQASDEQRPLWPGTVTFSDDYYSTLIAHAVPIDVRAFSMLKGSALAMDTYTFLADRLHRISGRPVMLYWANLREQFGQEYKGKDPDKDFKKKFLPALRDALTAYPLAKVKQVTGGLLLMASPPPVPYKGS